MFSRGHGPIFSRVFKGTFYVKQENEMKYTLYEKRYKRHRRRRIWKFSLHRKWDHWETVGNWDPSPSLSRSFVNFEYLQEDEKCFCKKTQWRLAEKCSKGKKGRPRKSNIVCLTMARPNDSPMGLVRILNCMHYITLCSVDFHQIILLWKWKIKIMKRPLPFSWSVSSPIVGKAWIHIWKIRLYQTMYPDTFIAIDWKSCWNMPSGFVLLDRSKLKSSGRNHRQITHMKCIWNPQGNGSLLYPKICTWIHSSWIYFRCTPNILNYIQHVSKVMEIHYYQEGMYQAWIFGKNWLLLHCLH